jgi:hypothetical protein
MPLLRCERSQIPCWQNERTSSLLSRRKDQNDRRQLNTLASARRRQYVPHVLAVAPPEKKKVSPGVMRPVRVGVMKRRPLRRRGCRIEERVGGYCRKCKIPFTSN